MTNIAIIGSMKLLNQLFIILLTCVLAACSSTKTHKSISKKDSYQPSLYSLEEEPAAVFIDQDMFFNTLITSVDYNEKQLALIELGKQYLGSPYVFGGNSPQAGGFDCSGFTQYIYRNSVRQNLPRRAKDMANVGIPVDYYQLKAGDLVFFNTLGPDYSHVGVYIGDGMFFHASPSWGGIVIADMNKEYFAKRYNGARRVLEPDYNVDVLASR